MFNPDNLPNNEFERVLDIVSNYIFAYKPEDIKRTKAAAKVLAREYRTSLKALTEWYFRD